MLRARMPGPYEDRVGPVALTILLVFSILVNMILKFIDIYSAKRTWGREGGIDGVRAHVVAGPRLLNLTDTPLAVLLVWLKSMAGAGEVPVVVPSIKGFKPGPSTAVHGSGPV